MQWFYNLVQGHRRRVAINAATTEEDPSRVSGHLARYPDDCEAIARQADEFLSFGAVWHALLLTTGLVESRLPAAITAIRQLAKHKTSGSAPHQVPWHKLNVSQATMIFRYLCDHGSKGEAAQFAQRLNDLQFAGIALDPFHPCYFEWFRVLVQRDTPLDAVCTQWVAFLDQSALKAEDIAPGSDAEVVSRAQEVQKCLLAAGRFSPWLRLLNVLSLCRPTLVADADLAAVNKQLLSLDDDDLERAARLLSRYPASEWTTSLQRAWMRIEDAARRSDETPTDQPPSPLCEAAACAVGAALGACVALNPSMVGLAAGSRQAPGLEALLDQQTLVVGEYNRLVGEHNRAALQRQEPSEALVFRLRTLREQISVLERQIDATHRAHRQQMPPVFMLWCVLTEAQRYPVAIRQAAAWGLHLACRSRHMDDDTRASILHSLRLAAESDGFQERRVQLLPNRSVLEVAEMLQAGLEWTTELVADNAPAEGMAPYKSLRQSVALLAQMPHVLDVLTTFPLRLMPLDLHKKLLGEYVRNGCGHTLWTRFTPPKWEPGMAEHEAGEVHRRYLSLEDRSTPNSMGIYYRLLRHPVLWLPIVYHEFLHHGGHNGNPAEAIHNETNVLLRELIFTRELVARLAPTDDADLPAFEAELASEMEAADVGNLRFQLAWDFGDDETLAAISAGVVGTYGSPCSAQEVDVLVEQRLLAADGMIGLENNTNPAKLLWHPEIHWPKLSKSPQAGPFRKILAQRFVRDHSLNPGQRDAIFSEPQCAAALKQWDEYRNRSNAMHALLSPRGGDLVEWEELVRRIVRRFDFDVTDPYQLGVLGAFAGGNRDDGAFGVWQMLQALRSADSRNSGAPQPD